MNSHMIYILECSNGSYYIGYTLDMERRYQEHCEGSAKCKYTRSFPPKQILACWVAPSKQAALSAEQKLKRLKRAQKEALIQGDDCEAQILLTGFDRVI